VPTYSPCSVAEHSVARAMALNRCVGNRLANFCLALLQAWASQQISFDLRDNRCDQSVNQSGCKPCLLDLAHLVWIA